MFRILAAAVIALGTSTISHAKVELSKDGLEYLGLSRVPETGEIKEIWLESVEPTSEKDVYYATYSNFSSSTVNQSLAAVVYCDDNDPRIVTETNSGTVKPNLKETQNADTRLYGRVCGKAFYIPADKPVQILKDGPVPMWGLTNNAKRVALDSNTHITNLFKLTGNVDSLKDLLFFCNNDYPSVVKPINNNEVVGYEEIVRLANSKNDYEYKRGRIIATSISEVCPNVTSLNQFVLSRDEFIRTVQSEGSSETQPSASFPNPFMPNSDRSPEETVRSIYGQYLLAKATCENDSEGEYRLEELRDRMTSFDKWVNSQGLDGNKLWKEAAAASEKNIFHLGAKMNSMLPDGVQAANNCRSVINLAMSAVNNVLRGSGESVEKDF